MRTVALRSPNWLAAACCALVMAGCPDDTTDPGDTTSDDTSVVDTVDGDTTPVDTSDDTTSDTAVADTSPDDTSEDTASDTVAPDTVAPDTTADAGPEDTSDGWTPPRCGDGHIDFGEDCDDGDEQNSDTLADHCRTDCKEARCGDGVADTGETCDDGDDNDYNACTTQCETGPDVATPAIGDLVITEVMIDPDAVTDIHGEWIELYNATEATLNVAGCVVHDDGTDAFTLTGEGGGLLIAPGELLVLASDGDAEANGGFDPDFVYTTMLLDNAVDEVVVTCGDADVDRLAWTALEWRLVSGQSLSLDPTRWDATNNDAVGSWCSGVVTFGDGDLGTPGTDNPPCFQLDTTVDSCVLTMPAGTTGYTGYPLVVTVSVGEFGVTDLTNGVDVSPNLLVELGHGPNGTDPTTASWSWLPGVPTPGWVGDADRLDGYERGLVFDGPTTRDVAARASRDDGATWSYCDRGAGAEDGYSVADAASVTIVASPCQSDSCLTPEPPVCAPDGVRVATFEPEGACVPTASDAFDCVYTPAVIDCGAGGQICEDGACGAVAVAPAVAGEVVFTELMVRPAAVSAEVGQWIELTNASDRPIDLGGCSLTATPTASVEDAVSWTIPGSLVLPTGRREVVGASVAGDDNGGAPVGVAWDEGFALPTAAFDLALDCGDLAVDLVPFGTGSGWPSTLGAAASLSPFHTEAVGNDDSAFWCVATQTYGVGDRGTPGEVNGDCPGDVVPVDACSLVGEATLTARAGVPTELVVRVTEAGITSRSVRTDVDPKLIVEVGMGPAGALPGDAGWSWTTAEADGDWFASTALGSPLTEDRYLLHFPAPAPGDYDALARVTADGGNTWSLCDLDGIVTEGAPAPQRLVVEASACYPDPCGASPGHVCEALDEGDPGPPTVVIDLRTPAVCTLDDDNASVCTWVEDFVEDCAEAGAECQGGACANFPVTPQTGEAVISEIMIVPPSGELGEWIEISNPGPAPLELTGCVIRSGPNESWAWPAPEGATDAVIAPGSAIVVARSPYSGVNGGANPREVMTGVSLDNLADWVALECDGATIDLVAWNIEDDWVVPSGRALSLAGNRIDAGLNDFAPWWCAPASASPNQLNPLCPPPDTDLDNCLLVDPAGLIAEAGVGFDVSGLLLDVGVTDVRPGPDPAPGTLGQVGFGPAGSDPEGGGWTWVAGVADADWDDASASGYDQWTATATLETPGTWAAAFRFSADDGATWRYCDLDGGSYEVAAEGTLAVEPGICVPNPCGTPPANTCSGANLVGKTGPGTCSIDDESGEASCAYGTLIFSCAAYGGCSEETGSCGEPPLVAQPGDVVINEIMRDSVVTEPDKGEWIELHNMTDEAIDLRGCEISDGAGRAFTVEGPVPISLPANGYYVLATSKVVSENGTLPYVGWGWGDAYSLANTNQTIILGCGGAEIDRVAYAWDWPSRTGYAMQLHNGADGAQNDDPAWWCEASAVYGGGNRGTPRAVNKVCQGVPETP